MPRLKALEYDSEDAMRSASVAIRSRLMNLPKPVMMRRVERVRPVDAYIAPKEKALEETAIELPVVEEPDQPLRTPLNMLAPPSWKFLISLASARTGVSVRDIMSESRLKATVHARYIAIGLIYSHQPKSTLEIGRILKRDHSTCLRAIKLTNSKKFVWEASDLAVCATLRLRGRKTPSVVQDALKQAVKDGKTLRQFADDVGYTYRSIRSVAIRLGIDKNVNMEVVK